MSRTTLSAQWIKTESGLYVPEDAPQRATVEPKLRRTEERAVFLQALAALLALVFAIPALVISFATLEAQQEINASQVEVNKVEQQRFAERYASQVTWWLQEISEVNSASRLSIQNRSTVPIVGVKVRMLGIVDLSSGDWAKYDTFSLSAPIPPCTTLNLNFAAHITPVRDRIELYLRWGGELQISFSDGQRTWVRGRDSLDTSWSSDFGKQEPNVFYTDPFNTRHPSPGMLEPINDCGSA